MKEPATTRADEFSAPARLLDAGVDASVGTVGDAYDNALAETTIGLFKTELQVLGGVGSEFEVAATRIVHERESGVELANALVLARSTRCRLRSRHRPPRG